MGRSVRLAAVATIFAAFTAPASVPGAPEVFAPAFIVVLFETSFQANGDATNAIWMMRKPAAADLCCGICCVLWRSESNWKKKTRELAVSPSIAGWAKQVAPVALAPLK